MKKHLNEQGMQSELSGSAFFQSTADLHESPSDVSPMLPDVPAGLVNGSPFARTPVRRTITRCAFEFYQDQVDRLRHYALEAKTRGEKGSMSEMVREAIDLYLSGSHRPGG